MEVSSRPAETMTALARAICTASSVVLRLPSPCMTLTPNCSASSIAAARSSITTMVAGSAPRRSISATASLPDVPKPVTIV